MNKFYKFCGLFLIVFLLTGGTFAQTANGLPRLKKGESYAKVRAKMIKAGWKPYTAPDADECADGDARCQGRPEMQSCAGTGMANCKFLWKRKGKTLAIFTVGEDAAYDGHELE